MLMTFPSPPGICMCQNVNTPAGCIYVFPVPWQITCISCWQHLSCRWKQPVVEPSTTDALDWKQAFCFPPPLYDFTLEAREQNLTFPCVTKPPSKGVIDSIESLLWHMSVFVDFQVSWRTSKQSEKVKQYLCRPGSSCTPLGRPVNKHSCLSSQALIKQPPLLHRTVKLPQRAGGSPQHRCSSLFYF